MNDKTNKSNGTHGGSGRDTASNHGVKNESSNETRSHGNQPPPKSGGGKKG